VTHGRWTQELPWGATAFVLTAALALLGLNADQYYPPQLGFEAVLAGAILLYAGTGRLISNRVPDNAIGWLLSVIGLLLAGELLAEQYSVYGVVTSPGSLPAARLVGWSSAVLTVLGVCALLALLLLFPDGSCPRPAGGRLGWPSVWSWRAPLSPSCRPAQLSAAD
jgi:hypothetical protein